MKAKKINKLSFYFDSCYKLKLYAKRLYRLYEISCNFGLTSRQEKNKEKLEKEIKKIAKSLGFKVAFNGDPRGASFVLYKGKTRDFFDVNFFEGLCF